jgi:hypothetical protein
VTETSRRTADVGISRSRGPAIALRVTSTPAVLALLWQGATAGGIIMRSRESFEFREAGAIAVHVLSGLAAIAAFVLWRERRGAIWPTVVAAAVFACSFVQAAPGVEETMWRGRTMGA